MTYPIDVVTTDPMLTAVARETLPSKQIGANVIGLFDRVYVFLKTAATKQAGHNVAIY